MQIQIKQNPNPKIKTIQKADLSKTGDHIITGQSQLDLKTLRAM